MTKRQEAQENGRKAAPGGSRTAEAGAAKPEGRNRKRASVQVQLESQDDLAYLTGEHDAKEAEKQIKSPAPRRPSKGKESARSERR